jgi:hypothetical protein
MKKTSTLVAFALLLVASLAQAQTGTTAPTNNVNLTVAAEAGLTIAGDANLTSVGTNFSNYTGNTNFTYYVRTAAGGGLGSINLKVTSDFNGTGGPSVTTPPTGGDALTYLNTISAPGSAVAGSQTASTASTTPVATFGPDAHSTKAGNSGSVAWTLSNDPLYKTGSYTAVVTFTISAVS